MTFSEIVRVVVVRRHCPRRDRVLAAAVGRARVISLAEDDRDGPAAVAILVRDDRAVVVMVDLLPDDRATASGRVDQAMVIDRDDLAVEEIGRGDRVTAIVPEDLAMEIDPDGLAIDRAKAAVVSSGDPATVLAIARTGRIVRTTGRTAIRIGTNRKIGGTIVGPM